MTRYLTGENVTLQDTVSQQVFSMDAKRKQDAVEGSDYAHVNDVAKAAEVEPNIVVTSKGVKIRTSAIPNMMIAEARRKIKPPAMPKVYISDKETHEENPSDPEYVAALQDYNIRVGTMGVTAMLAFGAEVIDKPDTVQAPEDKGWSDDLFEIFEVEVPAAGKGRFAAWLRLYVLTDPDLTDVLDSIRKASGIVMESEVADAQATFRPDEAGDTAT